MKKNVSDQHVADEIVARAAALRLTHYPKWGSMHVTEMLHHCNTVNTMILEGRADNRKHTVKQRLLKFFFLHIMRKFLKNVKAPSIVKKSEITAEKFEEEKIRFAETIQKFTDRTRAIEARHPFFGKLNTREWGVFTWMHMDHHLRQFGA